MLEQTLEQTRETKGGAPLSKWLILALLVMGIASFFYFDMGSYLSLHALKEHKEALTQYTQTHYAGTVILFILIYCVQTALSLPGATILTLAGGFLFGTWWGALYVNLGASTGALLAFWAARYLFRDAVEKRFAKRLVSIQEGFVKNGFHYLLTLRLIPIFPFFLVNLAAGLTRISTSTYVLGTVVGILPGSLVYCNAGKQLGSINDLGDIASPGVLGAFVLLGLLALVPVFYRKIKKSPAAKTQFPAG